MKYTVSTHRKDLSAISGDEVYTLRKKGREILLHGIIPVDVIAFERLFTWGLIAPQKAKRLLPKYKRKADRARAYWIENHSGDYEGFFIAYGGFQADNPVVRVENERWLPEWMSDHDFEEWAFQNHSNAAEHVGYLKLLRSDKGKKVWTIVENAL